ncbi:hypothetical protein, partial [Stenotrophomonas pavanii]|uniref:hypothetical protein n=1 Tax=Stenotrophomonas pavanii TaxID=487698 RepID=UPI0039C7194A
PSLGAWPRHPCRGHPRNRTHPAFDSFPLLWVGADRSSARCSWWVSTKVDTLDPHIAWIY